MNNPSRTARLIAAAASVVITLTLLHAVFAIAEPQRSVLIAKLERADAPGTTHVAIATMVIAGLPSAT